MPRQRQIKLTSPETKLLKACYLGDVDGVRKILFDNEGKKRPLKVEAQPKQFETSPLFLAINLGAKYPAKQETSLQMLKLLVEYGFSVNTIIDGWTPIMFACGDNSDFVDAVDYLISKGADVSQNNGQMNVTHVAIKHNHINCLKRIHEQDPSLIHTSEHSTLFSAIEDDKVTILQWLLDNNVNSNNQMAFCSTPIHLALLNSQFACARILIENGADIFSDFTMRTQSVSLTELCMSGNKTAALKLLLECGAGIEKTLVPDDVKTKYKFNDNFEFYILVKNAQGIHQAVTNLQTLEKVCKNHTYEINYKAIYCTTQSEKVKDSESAQSIARLLERCFPDLKPICRTPSPTTSNDSEEDENSEHAQYLYAPLGNDKYDNPDQYISFVRGKLTMLHGAMIDCFVILIGNDLNEKKTKKALRANKSLIDLTKNAKLQGSAGQVVLNELYEPIVRHMVNLVKNMPDFICLPDLNQESYNFIEHTTESLDKCLSHLPSNMAEIKSNLASVCAMSYTYLASRHALNHDFQSAFYFINKASKCIESIKRSHMLEGLDLSVILSKYNQSKGIYYFIMQDYKTAKFYVENAIDNAKEISKDLAVTYLHIAYAFLALEKPHITLKMTSRLSKICNVNDPTIASHHLLAQSVYIDKTMLYLVDQDVKLTFDKDCLHIEYLKNNKLETQYIPINKLSKPKHMADYISRNIHEAKCTSQALDKVTYAMATLSTITPVMNPTQVATAKSNPEDSLTQPQSVETVTETMSQADVIAKRIHSKWKRKKANYKQKESLASDAGFGFGDTYADKNIIPLSSNDGTSFPTGLLYAYVDSIDDKKIPTETLNKHKDIVRAGKIAKPRGDIGLKLTKSTFMGKPCYTVKTKVPNTKVRFTGEVVARNEKGAYLVKMGKLTRHD